MWLPPSLETMNKNHEYDVFVRGGNNRKSMVWRTTADVRLISREKKTKKRMDEVGTRSDFSREKEKKRQDEWKE